MMRRIAVILAAACVLFAGQTRTWSQGEFADFEKGVLKNVSLRSDGLLTLAPHSRELFDTSAAYLWALARDSKGNLYAGGGTGAKLFRIPPDGKGKVLAELDGLEIHAIAVDSKDRVYAATSPDGKIFRMSPAGKPELFYDPKAKYIWSMLFDSKDDLYIATGDQGEVHRVTPDGKGKVFFKCDETHVRSMTMDASGNLILGTDPGGLVLRVSAAGEGFVLYQMPKREVTAVAVGKDGAIYAAAVGNRQPGVSGSPAPSPALPGIPTGVTVAAPGSPAPAPRPIVPPPSSLGSGGGVSGGSEVYRIEPSGNPLRVWSHPQEVIYAIAFDAVGRVLLGGGNKGNVYHIESPTMYTWLLHVPPAQITAFQQGAAGRVYAVTSNVGKVYEIGPELEREGTLESDVFDSTMFSLWGRVSFEAKLNGGQVAVSTRSGNLDEPQKNWSAWSAAVSTPKGGRVTSPAARFVQWKATLTGDGSHSPELESVDVAYLPKNVEPRIEEIEITPPNYKFPPPTQPLVALAQPSQSLTLPPLGKKATSSFSLDLSGATPAMQFAKGMMGARWLASDQNGDSLSYTVEIRGVNESEWKPLRQKLSEKYFSWDSTTFPDGEYRLRVTASDSPSNPPGEALAARLESDPFLIDNTPPRVTNLTAVRTGGKLQVRWHAADALNNVTRAEYSLDGGEWLVVAPVGKLSDSQELDYDLTLDAAPGEHTLAVRVQDDYDNAATDKVVVK